MQVVLQGTFTGCPPLRSDKPQRQQPLCLSKNSQICAFIVDMQNLIDECTVKPHRSPLPTVAEILAKIEGMRREGPLFGTTINVTTFYWSLQMAAEMKDLFRLKGADFDFG